MTRGSHFQTHNEHFCTSVKSHYIRMYSRFVVLRRAHKECEMWKQMLQDWGEEDCLICMTATGKLNIESELLVLNACSWALQIAVTYLIESHFTAPESHEHLLILHFFLPSGQIQEVTLSQEEPANQVEVTPELDLEVVPESSGDWHVFPWPQTTKPQSQKALYSVLSTDWVLELSFAKHFPLTQKSYLVRKRIGHYRFAALYIEGFYPRSSPLLFIQINSEVRGVWFPVIGLMTCICFVTVWLSSIWWPPERFGSINTGIPENSARRCRSLSCWPCLRNKPPP